MNFAEVLVLVTLGAVALREYMRWKETRKFRKKKKALKPKK